MKINENLAFQGDIALLKVNALPEGVTRVTQALNSAEREAFGYHPEKGLVLAQGESRAHYHAFCDTDAVEMYAAANDNRLFVKVLTPATLFHDEHDPIQHPEGIYELLFQKEYTFDDLYAKVAD